jgi:hypothetical protein
MAVLSHLRHFMVVLATCACLPGGPVVAQPDRLTESEIKAGFLYNFTKFVQWPPETFANPNSPFVLGVIGSNPFGDLLTDAAAGKTVDGRAVLVKQFRHEEDFSACQILFVSSSEKKRTAQMLEQLKGASVLSVGEGDAFTQAGGMIAFIIEGDKVRLAINLEAAQAARIKISAKVIAVARLVGRQPQARN